MKWQNGHAGLITRGGRVGEETETYMALASYWSFTEPFICFSSRGSEGMEAFRPTNGRERRVATRRRMADIAERCREREMQQQHRKTQMQIDLEEDPQPIAKTGARDTLRHAPKEGSEALAVDGRSPSTPSCL